SSGEERHSSRAGSRSGRRDSVRTVVVKDHELGSIQKSAGIQSVQGDKVSPLLAAVREIGIQIRAAEGAIGGSHIAVRSGHSQPGARGDIDNQTGFVPILGGWGAGNDLHGLHRIQWKLVGEDLALLVGDWLAIDREGVLCVIADSVKQAVRVGRYSGR